MAHLQIYEGDKLKQQLELADGTLTIGSLLQARGYHTAMVGKWHLKSAPTGFDHWEVLPGQGAYYNPDLLVPDADTTAMQRREGYVTDIVTDLALEWLAELDAVKFYRDFEPGQEIVARTHYLGKVKRHPRLLSSSAR